VIQTGIDATNGSTTGSATGAQPQGELPDVEVNHCSDMAIYVPCATRHVVVTGCWSCLIFVGAAAGSVIVRGCEGSFIPPRPSLPVHPLPFIPLHFPLSVCSFPFIHCCCV
jgi:hypothetical protein